MSLDYLLVKRDLEGVKFQIDNLVEFLEANSSKQSDANDLEVYVKLADISLSILQCDRKFETRTEDEILLGDK